MLKKRGVGFFAPSAVKVDPGSRILLEKMTEKEDFMIKEGRALNDYQFYSTNLLTRKRILIDVILSKILRIYVLFMRNSLGFTIVNLPGFAIYTNDQLFNLIGAIFRANRMDNYAYKSQINNILKDSFEWLEIRCSELIGGKNIKKEVFEKFIYE
jgi:hypothetical protein